MGPQVNRSRYTQARTHPSTVGREAAEPIESSRPDHPGSCGGWCPVRERCAAVVPPVPGHRLPSTTRVPAAVLVDPWATAQEVTTPPRPHRSPRHILADPWASAQEMTTPPRLRAGDTTAPFGVMERRARPPVCPVRRAAVCSGRTHVVAGGVLGPWGRDRIAIIVEHPRRSHDQPLPSGGEWAAHNPVIDRQATALSGASDDGAGRPGPVRDMWPVARAGALTYPWRSTAVGAVSPTHDVPRIRR